MSEEKLESLEAEVDEQKAEQSQEAITPFDIKLEAYREKKNNFSRLFLGSVIDKIRYWLWLRKLINLKKIDLYGGYLDKAFFEIEMGDRLSYNEDEDRKYLQQENSKEPVKQDRFGIEQAETRISEAKAVKQEYRRVKAFIESTQSYIDMVKTWQKN